MSANLGQTFAVLRSSFPRKRESSAFARAGWIPAFAGMTTQSWRS
jgi:hypothetical protein